MRSLLLSFFNALWIDMKKEDLRIIFYGSTDFSVSVLDSLLERNWIIDAVVTLPDKIVRRHGKDMIIPNYILKLAEKATDNEYKNNLYNCIDFIIEQLESYKNKIDILGETDVLCELIPTSQTDMNLLKDDDIKNILFSLGFYYNNDTEYITLEKDKIPEISFICQRVMYIKNIIFIITIYFI